MARLRPITPARPIVRRCTARQRRLAALNRAGRVAPRIMTLAQTAQAAAMRGARKVHRPIAATTGGPFRSTRTAPEIRATDKAMARAPAAVTRVREPVGQDREGRGRDPRRSSMVCRAAVAAGAAAGALLRGRVDRRTPARPTPPRRAAAMGLHRPVEIRVQGMEGATRAMLPVRAIVGRAQAPRVTPDPHPGIRRQAAPIPSLGRPDPIRVRAGPAPPGLTTLRARDPQPGVRPRRRRPPPVAPVIPVVRASRLPRPPTQLAASRTPILTFWQTCSIRARVALAWAAARRSLQHPRSRPLPNFRGQPIPAPHRYPALWSP